MSGNAVILATASGAPGAKLATANLLGRGVVSATASNKRAVVSLSGNAVVTSTASSKSGRVSISGRAIVTATPVPLAIVCTCPPWQIIDETLCGWKYAAGLISVQPYPFPFTIPVYKIYELALPFEANVGNWTVNTCVVPTYDVDATLTNTFTKAGTLASLFQTPQSLAYLFTNGETLVNNWLPNGNINVYLLPYTLPVFRMYNLGYVQPINIYSVASNVTGTYVTSPTESSVYKQFAVSGIQWSRGSCD